ncbi:MAG TPA: HEAT repeat domain-containing protein [Jiangellaceae bacterium]
MPSRPHPSEAVRAACERWGERDVALRCAAMLDGGAPELELLGYLSTAPSGVAPTSGTWPSWFPVWALRGLRYAWDPAAEPAVVRALVSEAWRVREMAAKVCLVREIGAAGDTLAELVDDPVPRVRIAAARAVAVVGESEHAPALQGLARDDDAKCRAAAADALRRLSDRLDRDLR